MVSTRSSDPSTCVLDPEIERTFFRRLKESVHVVVLDFAMANQPAPPTLRDLMNPDRTQQPLAVTVPALGNGVHFELKTGFINLFRGSTVFPRRILLCISTSSTTSVCVASLGM